MGMRSRRPAQATRNCLRKPRRKAAWWRFKALSADGKRQKLYFFTTLDLPPKQILELYGYRWNIETDLRSLKGKFVCLR